MPEPFPWLGVGCAVFNVLCCATAGCLVFREHGKRTERLIQAVRDLVRLQAFANILVASHEGSRDAYRAGSEARLMLSLYPETASRDVP